jgi:hypothetical protein
MAEDLIKHGKSIKPVSYKNCTFNDFLESYSMIDKKINKNSFLFIEVDFLHRLIHSDYKRLYSLYYFFPSVPRFGCKNYKEAKLFYISIREASFRLFDLLHSFSDSLNTLNAQSLQNKNMKKSG